ncbi:MAG: phosphatidate cytidylyltransferase [Spirochaetes bacterium]|nr:phosphatidate cytidylyltransferase [Spirochaetota bacterium]
MELTLKNYTTTGEQIQHEVLRKSIHLLVALVPLLAAFNLFATMALLAGGTLLYTFAEMIRQKGRYVFIISDVTVLAARDRDMGRFVMGPVTLGLGAMLSLLLYPEPAASLAIYALAFGDGFASLIGTLWGRVKIPYTGGKSIAGSLSCLLAVFFISYKLTANPLYALIIASAATILEMFPLKDIDNLILPVGTGLVASLLIFPI